MSGTPMVETRNHDSSSPSLHPSQSTAQGHSYNNGGSSTSNSTSNRLQSPPPMPPVPQSASPLSLQRPLSATTAASSSRDDHAVRQSHSHSVSSNPRTLASSQSKTSTSADVDSSDTHRVARSLPPWVQSADDDDHHHHDHHDPSSLLLPRTPTSVRPASHNYLPTPKSHVPGRRFDHARDQAPVTPTAPAAEQASKWQQFAKASEFDPDRPLSSRGQIVDDAWMKENMPDLEEPWQPMDQEDRVELGGFWLFNPVKRARFHKLLMNHPMVPLLVRVVVLTFSVLALALAGSIFHRSDNHGCKNNSSTWLAIIVDVVAIVYTLYITYDEYTSKPLGLRSHYAKMRLIFLDLAFIVFDSANLSLAFQALTDERWACADGSGLDTHNNSCPYTKSICTRQKALTATLLIALLAWLTTFAISTMRLIERVAR